MAVLPLSDAPASGPAAQRFVTRDCRYILENTLQPFAAGDVFLGCTFLNDPTDPRAGLGRILQCDANLRPKGVLWTEGHRHLLMGLAVDPQGVLWAFDIQAHAVIRVDPAGRQLPPRVLAERPFGAAVFGPDGSIYLAEALKGRRPSWATTLRNVPGTDRVGDGHVFRYGADLALREEYATETAPEPTGCKGVTHMSLHPGGTRIAYTTETGQRLMRYDLQARRQLPDIAGVGAGELGGGSGFGALTWLADGRLLVARGEELELYDEGGLRLRSFRPAGYGEGWSQLAPCRDPRHVLACNILAGSACKFSVETGDVVAQAWTDQGGRQRGLAGIAEFPGR